jgi:hypothetical protein
MTDLVGRGAFKRQQFRDPLTLLFSLCDSCMHVLSANAWKVVMYVGRQCVDQLRKENDPVSILRRDLVEKVHSLAGMPGWGPEPGPSQLEIIHDNNPRRPKVFAPISLGQFSLGKLDANGKRLDGGTGLSKSSITDAINEAIDTGILIRKVRKRDREDLPSMYGINWETVDELAKDLKRRRSNVRRLRKPLVGV